MTPGLHQTGYDSIDLTEITMRGLGRSQILGAVQRSRYIRSERAESS